MASMAPQVRFIPEISITRPSALEYCSTPSLAAVTKISAMMKP